MLKTQRVWIGAALRLIDIENENLALWSISDKKSAFLCRIADDFNNAIWAEDGAEGDIKIEQMKQAGFYVLW